MIFLPKIHLAPAAAVVQVGLIGTLLALAILYDTAFAREGEHMQAIAQSQVRLIVSVARFDAVQSPDYPGGSRTATISQFIDAHKAFTGFGRTGSFAVGERWNDQIVFLLSHRTQQTGDSLIIPLASDNAEPMRLALSGESGITVGRDYRGTMVLAAHEPIPSLALGSVAKIDLIEIRAPFIRAGLIALGITGVLIVVAIYAFRLTTDPILAALVRSREEAMKADRAKSRFLANVSHELRTPLNAIIGFSDMMRQQVFGPIQPDRYSLYVDAINKSGKHLLGLIENVLDMSHVEGDAYVLAASKIGVKGLIESILPPLRLRAMEKNIDVRIDVPDDLPPIKMDVQAAKQILINILNNAIKFTPAEGIVAVRAAAGVGGVVVTVRDTGVGISPDDLPWVTQPFTQIERENNRRHEGLGLGLALAKALAEKQGGTLAIMSEPGQGTTVTMVFPPA